MTKATEAPTKMYRFKILRGGFTSGSKHKGDYQEYQPEGNPEEAPIHNREPTKWSRASRACKSF